MIAHETWHMTAAEQNSSLAVMIIIVAVMIAGIWAIVTDVRDRWSIEDAEADIDDLTADYFMDRDQHAVDERAAMQAARAS